MILDKIESWSELVNCQPMTALVLIMVLFQRHHLQGYYYKANVQTLPPPYPPNVARRQGRKRETRREVRRILDISEVLVFVAWSRGAGEYLSWHSQGMLTADSSQVPQGRVMIHTGDRQRQVLSTENTDSGGKPLTRDFRSDLGDSCIYIYNIYIYWSIKHRVWRGPSII